MDLQDYDLIVGWNYLRVESILNSPTLPGCDVVAPQYTEVLNTYLKSLLHLGIVTFCLWPHQESAQYTKSLGKEYSSTFCNINFAPWYTWKLESQTTGNKEASSCSNNSRANIGDGIRDNVNIFLLSNSLISSFIVYYLFSFCCFDFLFFLLHLLMF